jgi:hypothetical protein
MSKNNTVVLRTPSAPNSKDKMSNMGVGFIDSVTLGSGEKRTVVHFLPEQPLAKGRTIMVFPTRGRELPLELIGHAAVGERNPSHVLYYKDLPVGSAWIHQGKRTKFLVVKVNKDVDASEDKNENRMTLFPRFPKDAAQ